MDSPTHQRGASHYDFCLAALVFSVAVTYAIAIIWLHDVRTLENTYRLALFGIGVVGFIILFARLFDSIAWALLIVYSLLAATTLLPLQLRENAGYVLGALGFFLAARHLVKQRSDALSYSAVGVVTAFAILAVARAYTWFDMERRLVHDAVHQDTLFHAAIAAMIKSYGIESTGVHGLVTLNYHTLSHRIMAALSSLSGVSVVDTYGVAPWILFSPILIFAVTASAQTLLKDYSVRASVYGWCLAAVCLTCAPALLSKWLVWDSYFVSESYLVGLGILSASVPVLANSQTSWQSAILLALVTGAAAATKGSVGLFIAFLCAVRAITFCRNNRMAWLAAIASLAALYLMSFSAASEAKEGSALSIEFLHFIKTWSWWGESLGTFGSNPIDFAKACLAVLSFVVFHFFLTWAVILLCLSSAPKGQLKPLLAEPSFILNAGSLVFGLSAAALLQLGGGAVYYFSNNAWFVALPFFVMVSVRWLAHLGFAPLRLALLAGAIICVVGWESILKKSDFSGVAEWKISMENKGFYDALARLRDTAADQVTIYRPTETLLNANPIKRASAKPLVYSAVTERVWTGTLEAQVAKNGEYAYYGYNNYVGPGGIIKAASLGKRHIVDVGLHQ